LPAVRLRCLAAALVLATLAACRVDTTADIVIREDGSGTVEVSVALDAEAVAALGGVERVRTADLEQAGWQVSAPAPIDDGGMLLSATKSFAGPSELATVFQEINGPGGPFLQPTYERSRSMFRNRYDFEAVVDLTAPVAALDDPQLRDLLTANGADVDLLRSQFGDNLGQAVSAHLVVSMPGEDGKRWDATANQRVEAEVSTSTTRNGQVTKVLVAAALAGLAIAVALTGGVRALYHRVRRRIAQSGPVPDPEAAGWYEEWDPGLDDPYAAYRDDEALEPPAEVTAPPPGWDPYGSQPDPRRN
jgi:hypothetical protein